MEEEDVLPLETAIEILEDDNVIEQMKKDENFYGYAEALSVVLKAAKSHFDGADS